MTTLLALDRDAVLLIAQQMEGGMIVSPVLAKELRDLIASAKPAPNEKLLADLILEHCHYGRCRGPVHVPKFKQGMPCECRHCTVLRQLHELGLVPKGKA